MYAGIVQGTHLAQCGQPSGNALNADSGVAWRQILKDPGFFEKGEHILRKRLPILVILQADFVDLIFLSQSLIELA